MTREEVLRHPAYWFENEQNELYSQVTEYMERENINQTQLAEKLKVGKSYVSQILKGNSNFSLKKWIELCLAIGIVPAGYRNIEDVIKEDKLRFKENSIKNPNIVNIEIKALHYLPYKLPKDFDIIQKDSKKMEINSRITVTPFNEQIY